MNVTTMSQLRYSCVTIQNLEITPLVKRQSGQFEDGRWSKIAPCFKAKVLVKNANFVHLTS